MKRFARSGCIVGLSLIAIFSIFSIVDQLGWLESEIKYKTITDSFTITVTTPDPPVFQYALGDRVLLKLGVEGIIVHYGVIEEVWKLYRVNVVIDGKFQAVRVYEFEIEKKID